MYTLHLFINISICHISPSFVYYSLLFISNIISKARFSFTFYKLSDVEVSLETKLILTDVHPSCSKVVKLVQDLLGVVACEAPVNSG